MYNNEKLSSFETAYRTGLKKAMVDFPDQYMTGLDADTVVDRMINTIRTKGLGAVAVRGSHGFKNACKALGIKQTYKDIEAYLKG